MPDVSHFGKRYFVKDPGESAGIPYLAVGGKIPAVRACAFRVDDTEIFHVGRQMGGKQMTDAFFRMRTRRIEAECISVWYCSKVIVFIHKIINSLRLLCRSAALLPLSPLRTVRATFTAYSSDNSKFNSHKIKSAHNHLLMTCFR